MKHVIKQYALEQGALEIQYIEEFFGEFRRKKTATEIVERLEDREHLIHMIEAPLADEPSQVVPVAFKVGHEIRAERVDIPKLADLVRRLDGAVQFDGPQGALRVDRRHASRLARQGVFPRAQRGAGSLGLRERLPRDRRQDEEQFYEMRGTLDNLRFEVVKFEPHPADHAESKVYLSRKLDASVLKSHKLVAHRRQGLTGVPRPLRAALRREEAHAVHVARNADAGRRARRPALADVPAAGRRDGPHRA